MASPANSTASSSGGGVGESPQLSSPPVARQTRHLVEHRVERQRSVESIVPIRPHLQHPEPLPGPLNAEQASSNRVPSSDSGNAASRSGPVGARYGNRLPYGLPGRRVGRKMKRPTAPVPVVASSRSPWPPPSHGTRSASPKMSGRNFGNPVARDRRSTTRSPQAHQSSQHWSLLHSPAEQPSPDERPLEDGGPSCVEYAMPPPHRKRLPAPYQQGLPERHPCAALEAPRSQTARYPPLVVHSESLGDRFRVRAGSPAHPSLSPPVLSAGESAGDRATSPRLAGNLAVGARPAGSDPRAPLIRRFVQTSPEVCSRLPLARLRPS
jgi:hypothetical protein